MQLNLSQVEQITQGRLRGDPERTIDGLRSLEAAGPSHLSFVRGKRYYAAARASKAGALVVRRAGDSTDTDAASASAAKDWEQDVVEVENPDIAMIQLLSVAVLEFAPGRGEISEHAVIDAGATLADGVTVEANAVIKADARIGANSTIGAGAVIGRGVSLGSDCRIYDNATLYHDVHVGDRVIIHSGSVVGADGFGYVQEGGVHMKIPHARGVRIEDDVEIGALSTIDRGMLDDTVVRRGVKIDDHCHVAHNCDIGELTLMAGGSQISGSTRVGKGVVLAGQVGVSDNLTIGDGALLGAATKVLKDVAAGASLWGFPARDAKEAMRIHAVQVYLPEMRRRLQLVMEKLGIDPDS